MQRTHARLAWTVNAVVAWFGVLLTTTLSALGWYVEEIPNGHLYGVNAPGMAGLIPRLADALSYFTMWSNIVVAVAMTVLAVRPDPRPYWKRSLHLSALLMITVTAIVYALVLAPTAHIVGWSHVTNPINHILVPILTVVVWLVWGPRDEIRPRVVAGALVIPLVWIVFMLLRGIAINAYPYGFADVATYGYPTVGRTLLLILVFGLVIASIFWGMDVVLTRRGHRRAAHPVRRGQHRA